MKQFLSLQYLRAFAALGVVAFHAALMSGPSLEETSPFVRGQFGVDLFFVLSGFIMWTTTVGVTISPGAFFRRRIARIVPIYWLMTIVAASIATSPRFSVGLPTDLPALASSLLFMPAWSAKDPGLLAPVLTVGWTLNLEIAFYALFAASLAMKPARRLPFMISTLAALAMLGLALKSDVAAIVAYTNSAVIEFAYGLALGHFYRTGALQGGGGGALVIAGFACAFLAPAALDWRGFSFGIAAASIVAGCLLLERRLAARPVPFLKMLGDASYSLYLTHGMAIAAIGYVIKATEIAAPTWLVIIVAIVGASAAAIPIHLWIEKPATEFAQRAFRSRRSSLRQSAPA